MIAVLIVNWNGYIDTTECLESLLRLSDGDFVVFLIDNGSTDGSLQAIVRWAAISKGEKPKGDPWIYMPDYRRRPPNVRRITAGDGGPFAPGEILLVETGANLGFAGGNNVGLALARRDPNIDYVWLLNNDTVVADDCLTALKKQAHDKPWAAMIGARLMFYNKPKVVQGIAGTFNPWRAQGGHIGMGLHSGLPGIESIEARMDYVIGASIFLPMSTYDEVGPMEESYFLYFEEPDWAYRLKRGGADKRLTVALDAIVYHKEGASIGSSATRRPSDISIYYKSRNTWRFMWRWHRWLLPLTCWWQAYEIAHYLRHCDWRAVGIVLRAFGDAVMGRRSFVPGTEPATALDRRR